MSTTATATRTTTRTTAGKTTRTTRRFPLLRTGAAAGAVAAAATTAIAAAAHAAGVSYADATGQAIPWVAFGQLTFIGALLGAALAAAFRRRAAQPRRTFTRTAWTLAVVSCAAPTLIGLGAAAVATLVVLHLVAAAVIIPAIGSRLSD
ncbi:peptidoglycan/LPS O-acetylase OafA/YrhL [Marmoricola sp. URHA0025 HA25]